MSMHLVGPYMTTTQYNRKQKSTKNKRLAKAKTEHEAWLKSMGVGKTELPVDKKGRRVGIYEVPDYRENQTTVRLSNSVAGTAPARKQAKYTGDEIAGIVTTHKSNLMPVRRDNKRAIVDAAQMRRS
jgi:inner membrane protein involved in colicin E2 resistance